MAKTNRGLGMGLEALLKMNVQDENDPQDQLSQPKDVLAGFVELALDKIMTNPNQPRKQFDETLLDDLAQSIKNFGLIQPISVIKNGEKYEIIAGERRYRAAKKIGLDKVPVIIKDISQKEKLEVSLVENIQRENLNPIEEALAFSSLIESYNMTQEELSGRLGKSRTAITNAIRLLNLDVQIRSWIMEQKLSPGHARCVLSLDEKDRISFAQYVIEKKLSVREAESLSKRWPLNKKEMVKNKKKQDKSFELQLAEDKLQQKFQTKVIISGNSKKGKIQFDYYSQDELERIIDILGITF